MSGFFDENGEARFKGVKPRWSKAKRRRMLERYEMAFLRRDRKSHREQSELPWWERRGLSAPWVQEMLARMGERKSAVKSSDGGWGRGPEDSDASGKALVSMTREGVEETPNGWRAPKL